ncbi:MAG: bifunctional 3,4-dihydroxy-2-butanone-4-phosphate synthase/GTP cyclohydrolase II [Cyanobium sp. MAG_216]|uniref:bifunctional 3,4-dihydroxy-2-butanone-4-phosphate synthase/GTP cyclohydrolase II n=1 Tax=Cyanobium usitatum TaxID=2304190 RepID=UPI0007146D8C|nr:bifunctional 3,4-dihydroxy-2-butanone-4-phosphate synthase/GTP cyclohydrolase II [Cyanobium usitatum]KRO93645.1 MAG: 3,4-dihydroxy-2-butanone 4-phosphate synthase [cyanobacterium BACL30 MAG-120619-bin27]MDP4737209.1 bifunctional 3,4-dihydroxy-2-butanone-4-phosphate synthase/GTP cyclohydrolase II [Cyanobium sp. MAG_216]
MAFDSVADGLAAIRNGESIVVVDDENRENEGDLICAAQFATPEQINFMATEARGLICLAMEGERLDALDLPLMVDRNTDSNQTAFTVSVDAGPENGVSTGISADDRARTIQVAIHPHTRPADLRRPGHIFPLRAKQGGVLKRAGHTEAAVDLARLSGLYPAGVICEIQNSDGSMARLPQLAAYAKRHGLRLISIAELISYRLDTERFVQRQAEAAMPSAFGDFRAIGYRNELDGSEHVAIIKGQPQLAKEPVLVRVHSECLTGDAFGSLRCDCRPQLEAALRMIEAAGVGVVVYLRQEGRGIGLINKLKAYSLQDTGLDTVEANERLGFAADLRNYGVGAQILSDLGIQRLRLITNNPRKIAGLGGYGLQVEDRVPLVMDAGSHNAAYLQTKRIKLGHLMGDGPSCPIGGPTAVLAWHGQAATSGQLEQLQLWALKQGLQVEREEHPRLLALLDQPQLALLLSGLDHAGSGVGAVAAALVLMGGWPKTERLSLLLAPDGQRSSHPSADLESEQRPLADLGTDLIVQPGAFLIWR